MGNANSRNRPAEFRITLFFSATSEKYPEAELQIPRGHGRNKESAGAGGSEVLAHAEKFVAVQSPDVEGIDTHKAEPLRHGDGEKIGWKRSDGSRVRTWGNRQPVAVDHGIDLAQNCRAAWLGGLRLAVGNSPVVVVRRVQGARRQASAASTPNVGAAKVVRKNTENRVIQGIERVHSQLNAPSFRDFEIFLHGKVESLLPGTARAVKRDRKSTRLNSSHTVISYAVFCLKRNACL